MPTAKAAKKRPTAAPGGPQRPGRPRDPDADRSIINATLDLIAEQGYDGVRVADVADRAGVAKTTMYRRWPSKTHLVLAALRAAPPLDPIDTGSLEEDLRELLTQFIGITETVPLVGLLASLAAERQKEPRLAQVMDAYVLERMRPVSQALQRGVARGEVPADADLDLMAGMLGGAVVLRLFFGGATDPETVDRLVDRVVRSAQPPSMNPRETESRG